MKYTVNIPAKPRNKKLANVGGTVNITGGMAQSVSAEGHSHDNKAILDALRLVHLRILNSIKVDEDSGGLILELGNIIREADETTPTDNHIFSALRVLAEIAKEGKKYFLSKVDPDTAHGLITFAKGLISDAMAVLKKGFRIGETDYGVNELGGASFKKITSDEKAELKKGFQSGEITNAVTGERKYGVDENGLSRLENITLFNGFQSEVFVPGLFGEGVNLRKKAGTQNQWVFEIQDMVVNGSLDVNEIIVKKWTHVGAGYIFSAAGFKVDRVEDLADRYRVYPKTKEENDFKALDQVLCQSFKTDGTSAQSKRYWRLCVGVASDRSYIDLSKTDAQGSSVPGAGDDVIQLGYRGSDNKRKGAIVISSFGEAGPYFQSLRGIDSFDLSGKTQILIGDETIFRVNKFEIQSGSGQFYRVPVERGAWSAGTYYYYDRVSHNGSIWLCVAQPDTTLEPQAGSAWEKQVSEGEDALYVNIWSDKGNTFTNGVIDAVLSAHVWQGRKEITASIAANMFNWKRRSINAAGDLVWNSLHAASGSSIRITGEDVSRSAVFSCEVFIN